MLARGKLQLQHVVEVLTSGARPILCTSQDAWPHSACEVARAPESDHGTSAPDPQVAVTHSELMRKYLKPSR